jgi:hypothetical protein
LVEVTIFDEGDERQLGDGGRAPVDGLAESADRRDERWWCDQEAEPKGRGNSLAERPDVDHAPVTVEALQRLQRSRDVAELAVVVVLEHGRVVPARPSQQLQSSMSGQHDAERELVRRRDIDEPGLSRMASTMMPCWSTGTPTTVRPWLRRSLATGG